jgi:hypothetical protein
LFVQMSSSTAPLILKIADPEYYRARFSSTLPNRNYGPVTISVQTRWCREHSLLTVLDFRKFRLPRQLVIIIEEFLLLP